MIYLNGGVLHGNYKFKYLHRSKEEIFNELEIPNDTTAAAIEEGRKIMNDPSTPRYSNIEALKKALDV